MYPRLSKATYQIIDAIAGQRVYTYLKELEETQWYSREDLEKLQWQKLRRLLQHAFENTLYYHEQFKQRGLYPKDIDGPEAFRKLPFLTKDDIRKNISDLKARGIKHFIADCTSGSTGAPLTFFKERSTSGHFLAAKYRGHRWHNIDIGDKEVKFWGLPVDRKPKLRERVKDFLINRTLFLVFDISPEALSYHFMICQNIRPNYMYGYASALYRFAKFLEEESIDAAALKLRGVISTSEVLYEFERELIQSVFGCPVINEYGACEAGVIAFECPEGRMHITAENVYLEILRENGEPVRPGETGQVVLTDLNNYGMPFIRYQIGDLATCVSDEEHCKCARGLPLLGDVMGRALDTAVSPSGKVLHAHVFNYVMRSAITHGAGIKEFRVVQKDRNRLLIKIVAPKKLSKRHRDYITKQIEGFMGEGVRIEFELVESIPLEISGKFRFFVSEVPGYRKGERVG